MQIHSEILYLSLIQLLSVTNKCQPLHSTANQCVKILCLLTIQKRSTSQKLLADREKNVCSRNSLISKFQTEMLLLSWHTRRTFVCGAEVATWFTEVYFNGVCLIFCPSTKEKDYRVIRPLVEGISLCDHKKTLSVNAIARGHFCE